MANCFVVVVAPDLSSTIAKHHQWSLSHTSRLPRPRHLRTHSSSLRLYCSKYSLSGAFTTLTMRIRKGHRLSAADRPPSHEGFANHARVVDAGNEAINQASPTIPHTSDCSNHQDPESANEGAEGDLGRKRLSADGNSRRRPRISEGEVLTISSIIQAGKDPARRNSASAPASAESVVTSDTSAGTDCRPPVAMENFVDQGTLLLQSLRRVCAAAGSAGLTPKEAVAKIVERGLPGLNEGGERLIVQVAKSFRASSSFLEERGRYFMQEASSLEDFGVSSDTRNSSNRREKAVPSSSASEIETAMEAARQLQNLQRSPDGTGDDKGGEEKAMPQRRVGASRISKSGAKASSSAREILSGPWCNRDDGKGWRCFRPAESGFSLCKYHRDQIRRAEVRRKKLKNKSKEASPVNVSNPTPNEVPYSVPDADIVKSLDAAMMESDDELPDHKRRRSVKAKSLKSIL